MYGIKEQYLNEDNFDQLPEFRPQKVTNGLILELYAYCKVHNVINNALTCSKLSFLCRKRQLRERVDRIRNVKSKEGE